MLRKVAAVLLAASMITAPALAVAGTTSPAPAKTAQPAKASVKAKKIVKVKTFKRHHVKKMKRGRHVRFVRVKPAEDVKPLRVKRIDASKRAPAQTVTKPAPKPATSGQR